MSAVSRRPLIIGVVVGVVLLALGIGIWRWQVNLRANEAALFSSDTEEQVSCATSSDPEACERSRVEALLVSGDVDASACDAFNGEERDACLWTAARSAQQEAGCSEIEDETAKNACIQELLLARAIKEQDRALCTQLQNPLLATGCEETIRQSLAREGTCEDVYEAEVCIDRARLAEATEAKDPDLCRALVNTTLQEECLDVVGVGDRDKDGLDAVQETSLGTDDRNPDTDGDGLTDKEERDGGTNPLLSDTDGDGFSDGSEVENEYDPLSAPAG